MKILAVPNPILSRPAQPVTKFNESLRKLILGMEETLKRQHDPEGVGLAATQIGKNLRLAIIQLNFEKGKENPLFLALINPKITKRERMVAEDYEGCLSVPNQYGLVPRDLSVKVEAQDLKGERIEIKAEGFLARIIQHEIDHLEGKLITQQAKGKFYTGRELEKLLSQQHTVNG